jgi:CheY-like chemotaxis protein
VRPTPTGGPVEILLVEDNEADAKLMIQALKAGTLETNVTVIDNGEDAVAYLFRQGPYADAPRPHLILLDLYLPRLDGNEVLLAIKADEDLRRIPIVVLTGSRNAEATNRAWDDGANSCVSKPHNQEAFRQAVRTIETFWLTIARRC